jgi:hypothetical protein
MSYSFNVRFNIVNADRMTAYVNDEYSGIISIKTVRVKHNEYDATAADRNKMTMRDEKRLTYRAYGAAFRYTIPLIDVSNVTTVEDAMRIPRALEKVTQAILRNYLCFASMNFACASQA